jgi:diacylglycerol O-acyltransferase
MATGDAGQAMGMMVVDLPIAEPDPLRRLARINQATTTRKAQLRAAGGNVTDILRLPLPLVWAFVRWGRRIGSSRVNLSVSDVPGPLSYAGSLAVAVNADAAVVDLDLAAAGMTRSFSRYRDLAALGEHLPQL